ncbi:hypothetical protein EJB05_52773, partial [Eragrostis curvula]
LYNNIHRLSKLVVGADFHCLKDKIEPKWEDPICANGGKWTISCGRGKSGTILITVMKSMEPLSLCVGSKKELLSGPKMLLMKLPGYE